MDFRFSPPDASNEPGSSQQQQLTPLSALSQAQHELQAHQIPHTLPPLQSRQFVSSIPKSSFDLPADAIHTPHSARLPRSAAPNDIFGHAAHYPSIGDHSSIPAFLQPDTLLSNHPIYGGAVPSSQSHPQMIAPAPLQGRLPDIRPMPTGGMSQPLSLPDQGSQGQIMQPQTSVGDRDPPPTHVVGSQGRRGILPSAPGRAPALGGSSAGNGKSASVPTKDADGKFPCPYCSKTYLHAKHLKRHLLRRESGCKHDSRALANFAKILGTVHTCAFSVKTPSPEAISSRGISRNARSEGATRPVQVISRILRLISRKLNRNRGSRLIPMLEAPTTLIH